MEKLVRDKKKRNKSRLFFAGVLGASMLSLTSCYSNSIMTQFARIGALFNMDPAMFQLLDDPARSLGTNIVLDTSKSDLTLNDVIEPTVRTMNRRLFSTDYFDLVTWKSEDYDSYFDSDDFKENTHNSILRDEKVEELKKDSTIITLFYKEKQYDGDIEGYVPAFIRVKDDWKEKYNSKYHDWYLAKVEKEQEDFLKAYKDGELTKSDNVDLGTQNYYILESSCRAVDVSQNKNLLPFKFGLNFFLHNSATWFPYDESFSNQYLILGYDTPMSEMAKTHYQDLNLSDLLGNSMPYDTYTGQLIFTAKENVVINSISFDLEVKTLDNYTMEDRLEDLTEKNMYGKNYFEKDNKFSLGTGVYRLDQGDNFYNYAKKFNGAMIAGWMTRKEYFSGGYYGQMGTSAYFLNYLFEGQDRFASFYDDVKDTLDFTFKEGKKYNISMNYTQATLPKDDSLTLKAVVNKGETFAINLELDDSQLHNMYKISNLKIDFDVFSSYDAPVWYTSPGFSKNENWIEGINF